ncbi:MAG: class I SAM-dependent methyltransferase [bacterium]
MSKWRERFIDDNARKPSGWFGKKLYSYPLGHYRTFRLVLRELRPRPDDVYLEIAQGGGVLLSRVLRTVERAAAIDHSADMVEEAIKNNREVVDAGRAEIVQGDAESMPWPDGSFTCAACTEAFFFFENPVAVLGEIHRVLKPGGRLVVATTPRSENRLAKAILTPYRRDLRLYSDEEMESMLKDAGFDEARARSVNDLRQICYAEKHS